jgi:hypothetical protein
MSSRSWVALANAAAFLGLTPAALRRSLERHAVQLLDGGVEAEVDGVRARKFGRLWRVRFHDRWLREGCSMPVASTAEPSAKRGEPGERP